MISMRYIKTLAIMMICALIGCSFVGCCKSAPYCKENNLYKYKSQVTIPSDTSPLNKAEAFLANMMDRYTGPFYIYRDFCDPRNHYVPSGWMSDECLKDRLKDWLENHLKVEEDWTADLRFSKEGLIEQNRSCIRIRSYCPPGSWVGVYWLDPLVDPKEEWGNQPGGFDLRGAKRLVFWAHGEKGGEMIRV